MFGIIVIASDYEVRAGNKIVQKSFFAIWFRYLATDTMGNESWR
ncbi:MAG: hypothetical protein K0R75_3784 [Paenibacillaceae bacterium]|nr:hypothetical protein [Paenibacillaceae bacterium]